METILLNILLFLGIVWMTVSIAYLYKMIFQRTAPSKEEKKRVKTEDSENSSNDAAHDLVAKSKTSISRSFPRIPEIPSNGKSDNNTATFASENAETEHTDPDQKKDAEGSDETHMTEENEMQVSYTMDQGDEEDILREELQIADEALPEVSHGGILLRDLSLIGGWHNDDASVEEESGTKVRDTLQNLQGTQLMEYLKEIALRQENVHQRLLAAIRKAEEGLSYEASVEDAVTGQETAANWSDRTERDEKPLSYYL